MCTYNWQKIQKTSVNKILALFSSIYGLVEHVVKKTVHNKTLLIYINLPWRIMPSLDKAAVNCK